MKKIIVAAAMLALCTGASAALKDGTYQGEGKGREGPVLVEVQVKGGKIADVKVLKNNDTEMIFEAAKGALIPDIVAKGTTKGVENVSGATMSTKGILDAVNDATKKAM